MKIRGTTIIGLRRGGVVAIGGDGQVSLGETIVKHSAQKIRRVFHDSILTGFAGSAADGITLFERFEKKLEEHHGNLPRAAVELAKFWRSDKILRRLEALLAVIDHEHSFIIAGSGEVIEPDDGIVSIGSGGPYALAAARAMMGHSTLDAETIVLESIKIAASICVYTNEDIVIETLGGKPEGSS